MTLLLHHTPVSSSPHRSTPTHRRQPRALCFLSTTTAAASAATNSSTKLQAPPTAPRHPLEAAGGGGGDDRNEFYLNVGTAVRTLREDLPALFVRDLDYHIYRDDITFMDPMNTFRGIENYKLIFWALRFHGRILFHDIKLQVLRVWQPSDGVILIRWNLTGVPRVPWEARGEFQGTSRYKLDRKGKIYEHKVDNLAFNFPRMAMKTSTVLDLVVSGAACPSPASSSFPLIEEDLFMEEPCSCSSWIRFYRAVRQTLNQEGFMVGSRHHDSMMLTFL